jgi:hypothetical protein
MPATMSRPLGQSRWPTSFAVCALLWVVHALAQDIGEATAAQVISGANIAIREGEIQIYSIGVQDDVSGGLNDVDLGFAAGNTGIQVIIDDLHATTGLTVSDISRLPPS